MLSIGPIPAFSDNYIWRLQEAGGTAVTVVDPGDAAPVLQALERERLVLEAILVTHHHADHTGGIRGLKEAFPDIRVCGPARESVWGVTHPVGEADEIRVTGAAEPLRVLEVPGHTADHIAYYGAGLLFCGDTLFAGGCGRVFDSTLDALAASLERLSRLPPETLVYCAHEYTLSNLGFARWVEPANPALLRREAETRIMRDAHKPSVPSQLAVELETNPFLRTRVPAVIQAAERWAGRPLDDSAAVFAALRNWKDREYD